MSEKQTRQAPQPPILTEAQIRQHASIESFTRGMSYYQRDAVSSLTLRGDLLQAQVEGGEYEPYRVTVRLDASGVRAAECTCPYEWGGWCKHIVAVLLAYVHAAPGEVRVRPPLADLVAGLDRAHLETLLRLAEMDAEVADRIDALIATLPRPAQTAHATGADAATGVEIRADTGRLTPVDANAFRQQIRYVFRTGRFDDHTNYASIPTHLSPLVAQIRACLDADDPQSALPLLEILTEEYNEARFEDDEFDEGLASFFDELGRLWAEALLASDLTEEELSEWRDLLEDRSATAADYGYEGLKIALEAAREGWSEPWIGKAQPDAQPTGLYTNELLAIRLRILERRGRFQDALNLAEATGMHGEQALILLRLNRVAEAVEVGRQRFSAAKDAFALAQALHERGDLEHALEIGERGLNLGGDEPVVYGQETTRARLAAWLVDLAAGQGRLDLALRAGVEALREAPNLALYQRLAELAGENWLPLRTQILEALRASKNWMASRRIDIFLYEGLIDDAIAALGPYASDENLARVMEAATASRPEWVIAMATSRAEEIMDAGKSQSYDVAIEWLRRARAAFRADGRLQEWQGYVQSLRAKHGRKYKLMGLLDRFERERS